MKSNEFRGRGGKRGLTWVQSVEVDRASPYLMEIPIVPDMGDRYAVEKLLEVLILREPAEQIDQSTKPKVVVYCLTMGVCHADLDRDITGMDVLITTVKFGSRSCDRGGKQDARGSHGGWEQYLGKYGTISLSRARLLRTIWCSMAPVVQSAEGAET